MADTKAAPNARSVPKRVDASVNPTDYTPTDKAAPTPAVPSGIPDVPTPVTAPVVALDSVAPDNEVSPTFRKPRASRVVDTVVDTARNTVERVKRVVEPSKAPKLSSDQLRRAVAEKDSERMRAVARYRSESRGMIAPIVRTVLRQNGIKGASQENIDAVIKALSSVKSVAGFRVDRKGVLRTRRLPITDKLAYTFGSIGLASEEWGARQWLSHPTLFDVALTAVTVVDVYSEAMDESSPINIAIKAIVDGMKETGEIASETSTDNAETAGSDEQ